MRANVGEELVVRGRHVGDHDREGVIVEIHGENGCAAVSGALEGRPRERVFPSAGTVVEHHPGEQQARSTGRGGASSLTHRSPPARRNDPDAKEAHDAGRAADGSVRAEHGRELSAPGDAGPGDVQPVRPAAAARTAGSCRGRAWKTASSSWRASRSPGRIWTTCAGRRATTRTPSVRSRACGSQVTCRRCLRDGSCSLVSHCWK